MLPEKIPFVKPFLPLFLFQCSSRVPEKVSGSLHVSRCHTREIWICSHCSSVLVKMRGGGKGHEFFGGTERSSEVLQEVIHRKKHALLGALPPLNLEQEQNIIFLIPIKHLQPFLARSTQHFFTSLGTNLGTTPISDV